MTLSAYPPPSQWHDWSEFDTHHKKRSYSIVPTVCFNCEASCGLLAYVDKETLEIQKFEGNPFNPNSRGRTCAKGPATLSQVRDPERILYPQKRDGPRGSGKWKRVSWDEAMDDMAARVRKAILDKRHNEIIYHVGRPGEDGWMQRTFQGWGLDAHNSHTNVCSSSARLGYDLWMGNDRPSPDFAHAKFILLMSSHLETGHFFNPHAQRIMEAKKAGAQLAVMDVRLSNTASMADTWMPTYPGSEGAVLLAIAKILIDRKLYNREFVEKWVNWQEWGCETFDAFEAKLKSTYAEFTLAYAEKESGLSAKTIERVALSIAAAGTAFSSHIWRNAAAGNLHGWQTVRALFFLNVLMGAVGTKGGVLPNTWNKFVPKMPLPPPPQKVWSELLWPREFPFAHHEMSPILPHLLKSGRGRVEMYFTRCYNPVWTNPDGGIWMEVLQNESLVGCHAALTPVWNETAWFADYVLPMGLGPERHDSMSFETHASKWITFRQPVRRDANPGEVWEEDEFWIEMSWRIDPDGALGIRKHFESPYAPGTKMTMDDFFGWTFENGVPGLAEKAKSEGLTALAYMKKYGAFEVQGEVYDQWKDAGYPTPSKKLEFFSKTLADWGWPEEAVPRYGKSHVHPDKLDRSRGEYALVPTFRLPTQVHTRSGNAKWLMELSHTNPMWIHPKDAKAIGVKTGELVRVETEIGYFVNRVVVTPSIMAGIVGCSHHFGRWRLAPETGGERWCTALVKMEPKGPGAFLLKRIEGAAPFKSSDPDSSRIWWSENGVDQNLTFPVHPDPLSGMHCWHQKVRVTRATAADAYGDVYVDTARSMKVYEEWMKLTKSAPGPGGMRRPYWLQRPFKPSEEAYRM
jgi:anaerobic selenocysteine-containing dehydrogenase